MFWFKKTVVLTEEEQAALDKKRRIELLMLRRIELGQQVAAANIERKSVVDELNVLLVPVKVKPAIELRGGE